LNKSNFFKKININSNNKYNILLKNIIQSYKTTKIKKNKKIYMNLLKNEKFSELKRNGFSENQRKTFRKYSKNIINNNNNNNEKIKLQKMKRKIIKKYMKNNTFPSSYRTVKINQKIKNVKCYTKNVSKLYFEFKNYLKTLNENKYYKIWINISSTYFRNELKKMKIFKKGKLYKDYCPICFNFQQKKLNKEEEDIYKHHVFIKEQQLSFIKKKKKN